MTECDIAGIYKNSEFDLANTKYMLSLIFHGFGKMGEPISEIIEQIEPK